MKCFRRRRHGCNRRSGLQRLWPDSIAGRVAVILLGALLGAKAGYWYFQERIDEREQMRTLAESVADRVINIVDLLKTTAAADRERWLRALSSPLFQFRCQERQPPVPTDQPWFADRTRDLLLPRLRTLPGSDVYLVKSEHIDTEAYAPELLPSHYNVIITAEQPDCGWLVVTVSGSILQLYWRDRPNLFGIVLTLLLISLFVVWLAHRETRPLRRFAEAADRLGVDVEAPPLPEQGSRELRKATQAFNLMQQRLQRFINDRTQMLAAISHDLRTVLTRLRLRIDFIDDDEQRQKAQADLVIMQTMLNETLAFARDDAAHEPRTALDLAELLQSLCDDWVDAGRSAEYRGPRHFTFIGRPVALQRMFGNLIENAIRYGNEATVSLITDASDIHVGIGDRGPGIAEPMHEKVFAPFFRLEPSRSPETGGSGLGLAVARSIARRHGGDITLAARRGGGLEVSVQLPRTQNE